MNKVIVKNFIPRCPKRMGIDNSKFNHAAREAVRTKQIAMEMRNKKTNKRLIIDLS